MNIKQYVMLLAVSWLVISCGESEKPNVKCLNGFDIGQELTKVRDELILPGYQDHSKKLGELIDAKDAFFGAPSEANLATLHTSFTSAYLSYVAIAQYQFGPAESVDFRSEMNNFPVDSSAVMNNITSGNYNLGTSQTFDKGYPALDVLLYGFGEETIEVLSSPAYKTYVDDVLSRMKSITDQVISGWEEYATAFTTSVGTDAGSSFSLVINQWNQNYEISKRERIGIPSGVFTIGNPNPKNVEAYYSQISTELLKASFRATKSLYEIGITRAVRHTNAMKGSELLDDAIKSRLSSIEGAINNVSAPISTAVVENKDQIVELYNQTQNLVLYTKTDAPAALCISITYVENPSDSD